MSFDEHCRDPMALEHRHCYRKTPREMRSLTLISAEDSSLSFRLPTKSPFYSIKRRTTAADECQWSGITLAAAKEWFPNSASCVRHSQLGRRSIIYHVEMLLQLLLPLPPSSLGRFFITRRSNYPPNACVKAGRRHKPKLSLPFREQNERENEKFSSKLYRVIGCQVLIPTQSARQRASNSFKRSRMIKSHDGNALRKQIVCHR